LYFIEDDLFRKACNETDRVFSCRGQHQVIIETYIAIAGCVADLARQGCLAALAGAMDQHDRSIGQCLGEPGADESGIKMIWNHEDNLRGMSAN
jgi:hypothetical protein